MISIEITGNLEELSDEWDALAGDTFTSVYTQPAWYRAWLEAFPVGRIRVLSARADGRLIGVLPFARIRADHRGLYFSRVAPFAVADYQPPLIAPEYVDEALPILLQAALTRFGRWGTYWFPAIPDGDPSLELVRAFFHSRQMPFVEDYYSAPRLRIPPGATFATVEKLWPQSHRTDVRRQRKRLASEGIISLWQPHSLDEAQSALEEYFKVHDEKWLSQGYPGRFQSEDQRRHFRALMRHFWGRGLHFSTVRCGSIDVSYQFGFLTGGWFQSYRPAFRIQFASLSPGKVHVALLVEEACRHGWQGIDFLQGDEPYKMVWSNEIQRVTEIHAGFHRWAPSYFWFSRGKPYFRKRLQRAEMRLTARIQKWRQ